MDTETLQLRLYQGLSEDLRKWFKDGGWNRYNTKGEKVGKCARDDKDGDGKADGPKPKCLPASKAASLGKKKVAAAVKRKRAEDPNPDRTGAAKNVNTESIELELRVGEFMEACWKGYEKKGMKTMFGKRYPNCVKKTRKEEVELKYDKSKKSEGNMPTVKAPGKAVPMPTVRGSKAVPMPRASVKTEGYGVSPNMDPSVPKSHNERMRDAREKSKKQGVFLPPWIGPELPRVKAKSKIQVSHYEPEGEKLDEIAPLAVGAAAAGLAAAPYLAKKFLKPKADKALQRGRNELHLKGNPIGAGARGLGDSYEPEGEDIQELGGLLDKVRSTVGNAGGRVGERIGTDKAGPLGGMLGRHKGRRTAEKAFDQTTSGNVGGAINTVRDALKNSYEPEGEVVSERSRLDGPEERKKDLDKRYDPKGGGKNPFQYVPVKQAMVKKEEVDVIDEKFKSQYGDKTKLSQSSERKSLGRGSSIKDGSKKRGYESKKEFRDQSMKLRKHRERFGDLAKESAEYMMQRIVNQAKGEAAKIDRARQLAKDVKTTTGSVTVREADGDPCWDSHKQVGMKKKGGRMVPNCVPKEEVEVSHKNPESVKGIAKELDKAVEMHKSQAKRLRKAGVSEGAAWTKKSGKNSEGGLNEKGRKSYERENPGSDLKRPSKKVGNKRRASFCARMKGMRKRQKPSNNTGEDRLSKSLRAWNC
jgi:hypothetical protein